MSLAAALFALVTVIGGVGLILVGLRHWRSSQAAALAEADAAFGESDLVQPDPADVIAQRIETLLQDQERRLTEAFSTVREDLSGLKSDVEWLAGERMIEQAIALAQTGSDPDEIGQELGLSRDAAATIAMFRKH